MKPESKQRLITKSDYAGYLFNGIVFDQYKKQMGGDLALNLDLKIKGFININQRRMHCVEAGYNVSQELLKLVKNLKQKVYWLMVTEHWCGDSSQSIPVFNRIAEQSQGKIEMKIVYRDQYPDLLDLKLSKVIRTIPKLIQLDELFNVTGIWGSRPAGAQDLMKTLRSIQADAATHSKELHQWYDNDKQCSLEAEITELLINVDSNEL